jgi:hypothetical protein
MLLYGKRNKHRRYNTNFKIIFRMLKGLPKDHKQSIQKNNMKVTFDAFINLDYDTLNTNKIPKFYNIELNRKNLKTAENAISELEVCSNI